MYFLHHCQESDEVRHVQGGTEVGKSVNTLLNDSNGGFGEAGMSWVLNGEET